MASITLKNLSASLHRTLKSRAKLHKRSLNQEVLSVLEADVAAPPKIDVEAMLAREKKFRDSLKFTTTSREVKAAIRKGRM